jgi:predicted CoA-binding protein
MRTSRHSVEAFLAQPAFALVGASRSGKRFGNIILRELRSKGLRVYPVHPVAQAIDGVKCYARIDEIPGNVGGVIVCVPPDHAVTVVRDAAAAGINHVWLQQGSESPYVETLCSELGLNCVAGECILMFTAPTGIHKVHRVLAGMLHRLPA